MTGDCCQQPIHYVSKLLADEYNDLTSIVYRIIEGRGYQYGNATDEMMQEIETLRIYLEDLIAYEQQKQWEKEQEAE